MAERKKRILDFDCPDCNANNPYGDGINDEDEIRCFYCGAEFRVKINEEGRMTLKSL